MIILDYASYRGGLVRDLRTLADVMGKSTSSALDFDDAESATNTLASLAAVPSVTTAAVYTNEGKLLAAYQRDKQSATAPAHPGAEGYKFENAYLTLFRPGFLTLVHPVAREGERIGTIYMQYNLHEMNARLMGYAAIAAFIVVGAASWLCFLIAPTTGHFQTDSLPGADRESRL
jgi:hypothetical protein